MRWSIAAGLLALCLCAHGTPLVSVSQCLYSDQASAVSANAGSGCLAANSTAAGLKASVREYVAGSETEWKTAFISAPAGELTRPLSLSDLDRIERAQTAVLSTEVSILSIGEPGSAALLLLGVAAVVVGKRFIVNAA